MNNFDCKWKENYEVMRPCDVYKMEAGEHDTLIDAIWLTIENEKGISDYRNKFLKVQFKPLNKEGEPIRLTKKFNLSWKKNSPFYSLLESFEFLPEPGESIDVRSMIGTPATIVIRNTTINNETVPIIDTVMKRSLSISEDIETNERV